MITEAEIRERLDETVFGRSRTTQEYADDVRELLRLLDIERAKNLRLRRIAAHVPVMVHIAAKEAAGYGVEVKAL